MKPKHMSLVLALTLLLGLPPAWGTGKYKVLHNFGSGKDGSGPYGPLVLDSQGNLYGVTGSGGSGQCSDYGCGTVFELMPKAGSTWKEAILHNFTAGDAGAFPWGALIFDSTGDDIYGTLQGYGSFAVGGVFELTSGHGKDIWAYNLFYPDGGGPGLLMDNTGDLYGAIGLGQYNSGAIAELLAGPNGWIYTRLYSFNGTDGLAPPAPPIWDRKGNMLGTTGALSSSINI